MLISPKCPYYRDSENLGMGKGLGHCDLGSGAICEGDIQFCENSDDLRKQLSERKKIEVLENRDEEGQKKKASKYKVLVVDDEEPLRNMIVAILSGQGHQCVTANNGVETLTKIHQDKFDAAITDIVMPQMNGIALTKELLKQYPKLPIFIMTGYSKQYPTELAIMAGAREFIGKPFSHDEFILRFNKMMKDDEAVLKYEAKLDEVIFQMHRRSAEEVDDLKKEIENLKNRLSADTPQKQH